MACQAVSLPLAPGKVAASAWRNSSTGSYSKSASPLYRTLPRARYTKRVSGTGGLREFGNPRTARTRCAAAQGSNGEGDEGVVSNFSDDLKQRAAGFAEAAKVKASEIAEETQAKAADLAEEAKRRYAQFEVENDPQGKAQEAWRNSKVRAAELGDDLRRTASRIDRDYKVTDKVKDFTATVQEKADEVDEKYSLRRRVATAWEDTQRNWPTFQRRISEWLQSPLGKTATVAAVVYLILSGWIFSILSWLVFLSFWVLPFLAPLLIKAMRGNVVQGQCPACKTPFAGPRTSVLSCRRCGGMVWQPRKDYSKADSKPVTIIDVEPE